MADLPERMELERPVGDEGSIEQPKLGSVASPPALLRSQSRGRKGKPAGRSAASANAGETEQLRLPLEEAQPLPPPTGSEAVSAPSPPKKRRRRSQGFVPVTRDPEVARSYSDSAAMDSAIAQGLAQVLTRLPPEELAALRARVAKAGRQRNSE